MFKMLIKEALRDRGYMFWAVLWPVVLFLIYSVTIGNIDNVDKVDFSDIRVAIVEDEFKTKIFNQVGFTTENVTLDNAEKKLDNKELDAYISKDNVLFINYNNEKTNLVKEVLRTYISTAYVSMETKSYPISEQNVVNKSLVKNSNASPVVLFYFGLVGLFIITSTTVGVDLYCKINANKDDEGIRFNIIPKSKLKVFLEGYLGVTLMHIVLSILITLFVTYVIKIPFNGLLPEIIGLVIVGTFFSVSFGIVISSILNFRKETLTGITVTFNLILCFFSGMMNIDILYYVNTNFKGISNFNPAYLISQALQGSYYYGNLNIYLQNLGRLAVMAVVCFALSIIIMRRRQYESL